MVLRKGFTLVELLVVMTILATLAIMMIGILNPKNLVDRGYDARKKKDVKRISMAFEEYYNDKGCYPTGYDFDNMVCNGAGFAPWITSWFCDPSGNHYKIILENSSCPKFYKIYAQLGNRNDNQIPSGWYSRIGYTFGDGTLTTALYNYGTSSTNVNWYDRVLGPLCNLSTCSYRTGVGCDRAFMASGLQGCVGGINCFANTDCDPSCQTDCCGAGCN